MGVAFDKMLGEVLLHKHIAEDVSVADAGSYFTGTNAEAVLQELGLAIGTTIPSTYLKLDASNDPVTGQLDVNNVLTSTDYQGYGGVIANFTKGSQWKNSVGTVTATMSTDGHLGLDQSSASSTVTLIAQRTNVALGSSYTGIQLAYWNTTTTQTALRGLTINIAHSGTGTATTVQGISFTAGLRSSGTITKLSAFYGLCNCSSTSSGTVTEARSFIGFVQNSGTTAITDAYVFNGQVEVGKVGGSITNAYYYYGIKPVATGTITNLYGLYLEDMSGGGTLNYAIYTNAGTVRFGDKVIFTQTDGNEYIDSLNDGYLDLGATTGIRLLQDTTVTGNLDATTLSVASTPGADASFSILDGDGVTSHDFVFSKGILTSYGTS